MCRLAACSADVPGAAVLLLLGPGRVADGDARRMDVRLLHHVVSLRDALNRLTGHLLSFFFPLFVACNI